MTELNRASHMGRTIVLVSNKQARNGVDNEGCTGCLGASEREGGDGSCARLPQCNSPQSGVWQYAPAPSKTAKPSHGGYPEGPAMPLASEAAAEGIRRAVGKVMKADPAWVEGALGDLRKYAQVNYAGEFTIEKARESCREVPDGTDKRAWGHVTRRAVRDGIIEATGRMMKAEKRHGALTPAYRKGPNA